MLINYLKIAFRTLVKQRIYSIINILGLSIGIASVVLIMMYVEFEYSYDTFQKNKDRLYKITLERSYPTHKIFYDIIPHSFANVMSQDFPEVEKSVRILGGGPGTTLITIVDNNDEQTTYDEVGVIQADSTFFEIFTFPLIKGNAKTVLEGANRVVLTESLAKKYFGDEEPLGKTIMAGQQEFTVSGVCQDVPKNSHIKFSMIGTTGGNAFIKTVNYISFDAHTYLLLKPSANSRELEAKFPKMVQQYAAAQIEQSLNTPYEDYVAAGNGYRYYLRQISEIHLDPDNIEAKIESGGNRTVVYVLISIAVLILLIACINFMNLATARATDRSREVGIRKTMGSLKSQLIKQFLLESVMISFISLVLALIIINITLPSFNALTENNLSVHVQGSYIVPSMLAITLLVGLLAGLYPAFILSSFNPAVILKGTMVSSKMGGVLRNGLVVFQFIISIILIGGTITVYKQLRFVQARDLGFDKNQLLIIDKAFILEDKVKTFRDEVSSLPGVLGCGVGSSVPGKFFFGFQFQPEGSDEVITTKSMSVNEDYQNVLGLKMIEGRGFSEDFDDSLSIILNEATVIAFGIQNPVGSKIMVNRINPQGKVPMTVIGVVKDFNFMSLKDEISPLVLVHNSSAFGFNFNFAIKTETKNIGETIKSIENIWKTMAPGQPINYSFLDTSFNDQYKAEQTSGKLFGIFSLLAILIACVGLFGLAAYTAGKKTKEIGIRKVMGASIGSIILLLSSHFAKLVLIAFIIASPIIWYTMTTWLEAFAYRISIGLEIYFISGLLALIIAIFTVSYQSFLAAIVNPVDSLGTE